MAYLTGKTEFIPLAMVVFSAACADTFSSELGSLSKGRVFNILNGRNVPKGLSGGVSMAGLGFGLLGSLVISLLSLIGFGLDGFILTLGLGFLGTIVDSILGILFQRKYRGEDGMLQDIKENEADRPVGGFMTNNAVNMVTISILPILGLVFI